MPGLYYEQCDVGRVIKHRLSRTVTESDNVLFCAITHNPQPLHLDAEYASRTEFGQRVFNSMYTVSFACGVSVEDTTLGTLVDHYLTALEVQNNLPVGSTPIISVAESSIGAINQNTFINASTRLSGFTWGAEDLPADIGAMTNRDQDGAHFLIHRMNRANCLLVASAGNMQAIDGICDDYKSQKKLRAECERARMEGFTGKLAIHPDQVEIINQCFTPSTDEVTYARRVVDAFANAKGAGTVGLDGRMLDLPHLKQAQRILRLVRSA